MVGVIIKPMFVCLFHENSELQLSDNQAGGVLRTACRGPHGRRLPQVVLTWPLYEAKTGLVFGRTIGLLQV